VAIIPRKILFPKIWPRELDMKYQYLIILLYFWLHTQIWIFSTIFNFFFLTYGDWKPPKSFQFGISDSEFCFLVEFYFYLFFKKMLSHLAPHFIPYLLPKSLPLFIKLYNKGLHNLLFWECSSWNVLVLWANQRDPTQRKRFLNGGGGEKTP
jgi:hypothetical protein